MRRKLDADALLCQLLIWLVVIGYVALVYVIVVALGTLPFSDPRIDFSPPWWLNLLALVLIALTFLPVYRWVRAECARADLQPARKPLPGIVTAQPVS